MRVRGWWAFVCGMMVATSSAGAQHKVVLRIAPHAGDTLKMRYDQQVDMMGVRELPASAGVMARDSTVMRETILTVLSRAIVEGTSTQGTDLLAVTDSVAIASTEAGTMQTEEMADQMLEGRQVHLRVNGAGETSIVDSAQASPELRAVFAQMPATLPNGPIAIGSTWKRTMRVPMRSPATLSAMFRLDSVTRDTSLAYISLQGTLAQAVARDPPGVMHSSMTGDVTGSMVVDRRRGWLVNSHAVITTSSVVVAGPAAGSGVTHVQMIVTQWLRTVN